MMIHDHVRLHVREPNGEVVTRNFQDRTMLEYRGKGFGLVLNRIPCSSNVSSASSSPPQQQPPQQPAAAAVAYHPIIVETMDHLRALTAAASQCFPSSSPSSSLPASSSSSAPVMMASHRRGRSARSSASPAMGTSTAAAAAAAAAPPLLVYDVILRNTYHIPTFQTFLGVASDPQEPFFGEWRALQDAREFGLAKPSQTDRQLMSDWVKSSDVAAMFPGPLMKAAGGVDGMTKLRFDAIALGHRGSAVITSAPVLTETVVLETVARATLAKWLCVKTANERFSSRWKQFYFRHSNDNDQRVAVRCYIGVGSTEFVETGSATTKRAPLSSEAVAMASSALLQEGGNPIVEKMRVSDEQLGKVGGGDRIQALQRMFSEGERSAVELAVRFGVTLLKRHNMRYWVCR